MKQRELLAYLKSVGVKIEQGKLHFKLFYNGKQTVCARHPSHEVSPESLKNIKRQLGIK